MIPNKFNLFCSIEHHQYSHIITNFLLPAFDFLTKKEGDFFKNRLVFIENGNQKALLNKFFAKGYLSPDSRLEKIRIETKKQNVAKLMAKTPVYGLIVPYYSCNLSCNSCKKQENKFLTFEMIDKIFEILNNADFIHPDIRPQILIGGGEPLLNNPQEREIIENIIQKVKSQNLILQLSTNGIELKNYMDILKDYNEKLSIDVRMESTDNISEDFINTIENAVNAKLTIALHVGITRQNLQFLPSVANLIMNKMWLYLKNFSAFVRPIKENMCACPNLNKLDPELTLEFIKMRKEFPQLELFNTHGWHGLDLIDFLIKKKDVPNARFYRCRNEFNFFIFAPDGLIYKCYEAIGNPEYSIGEYFPELNLNQQKLKLWQKDRLPNKCLICPMYPICNGGCMKLRIDYEEPLFNLPDCQTLINIYKECLKFYSNDLVEMFVCK